ncbi:GNAT family N-acetyltransferase [Hymenobacter psychrotolerans]|uniref:Acetyltransferase (GNAT) domain-containing protein n=1 Tax=Hymenobacter psychrotolerans DSM 18569 TaxID=1121959 RepID=A0A1M6YY39_9BACT|nr:GNAT family N-acetyltransferase [Hymenobacter psychrotolerans]SHL23211.1 Acetyltransferase (GNAT) domain-containing protein [Hymenobacter psychrotolerans DSM 18569]
MLLLLLRHHQLDLAAWDACVAQARQVVPYAQSWWLAATAGRWDAVVEPGAPGEYRAVLPLPVQRRPWGREVQQPPFTQQLGLLTTAASRHTELLDFLVLPRRRYARLYLQLHTGQELAAAPAGYGLAARITYQLPLAPSYATLHAGFAADYRRRLRLNAQAAVPLRVEPLTSLDELLALFRQHSGEAAGLKDKHYEQLRNLYAALEQHGQALPLEVRQPETGELLAGALFVLFRTRLIYLFAAASPAGKKAGAPLLLLDHAIRQHAGTVGLVLDFEGGMIPSIARFFANFGATPVPYAALSFTQRPWFLQWMR